MKQILKEEEIVGKTIKSNGYGDNAFCLIFTDDTFCVINGSGYDENDVEFCNDEITTTPTLWNGDDLVNMGLCSIEEAETAKENERKENLKNKEQKEYNEYVKLKNKYEK